MGPNSEFKIFGTIVVANSILVMDRLVCVQGASKGFCHDEAMLEDNLPSSSLIDITLLRPCAQTVLSAFRFRCSHFTASDESRVVHGTKTAGRSKASAAGAFIDTARVCRDLASIQPCLLPDVIFVLGYPFTGPATTLASVGMGSVCSERVKRKVLLACSTSLCRYGHAM